ncbi:MAG: DMT family transporter [Candidatus Obscuribacterales bacterium]|nr:DMT family transporter [Candidatus Obscuribacterales bacterium]
MSQGVFFGLAAALLFGLSTPLAKLFIADIQPVLLAGLLYMGSGLGLSLWWLYKRLKTPERSRPIKRSELPYLTGAVICGGMISPALLMLGLSLTAASTASLLLNLEGVLTAVLAWVFFKENCNRRIVLGMIVITIGSIVLTTAGQTGFIMSGGAVLIALACLGWAVDNNLTRQISHADAVQIALVKGVAAGIVNLSIAIFLLTPQWPPLSVTFAAMLVGFLGYGVSLAFFVLALRHLGTARTSAYFSTAPFVGAVFAILLFGEPISLPLLIAFLLMGFGVWLHLSEKHEHRHEHEAIVHDHEHIHDEHHRHGYAEGDPQNEPHSHVHAHTPISHSHAHFPDLHHRHEH